MGSKSAGSFAVVRFNSRSYQSGGVVAVIEGTNAAERALNDFNSCQSEEGRRAGWMYFLEKNRFKARNGCGASHQTSGGALRFSRTHR